jgi:cytochrome P450
MRIRLANLAPLYNTAKFRQACKVIKGVAEHLLERALKYKDEFEADTACKNFTFIMEVWKEMGDTARVRDQLISILLLGQDTTACLLSWTLFHLVRNPDTPQRLQKEISTIPKGSGVG